MPSAPLADELALWRERGRAYAARATLRAAALHFGTIERAGDGVAFVVGLPDAGLDELIEIDGGGQAMAVRLEPDGVACVLLGDAESVRAGTRVRATGGVVRVPVGPSLLGRVVDPLGRPLDGGEPVRTDRFEPAERPAPPIIDRELVTRPLETGLTVIDSMMPIGRGQRELIIGDRSTGKTALAVDTIIRQRDTQVVCVYAAIGQKATAIQRVVDSVREFGDASHSIFVVAEADSPPGLQWLAPFAACTMAEYFSESGHDVLVVFDDLTKHASVHRQLSLLLRAPPGREAYPGDVFYLHARLLERAAHLAPHRGGGSLTALPIAETQAGNLSAYIPTNLISITDGQIYLSPRLFNEGQKPAVSVDLSVSRVGGKAQTAPMKLHAESLKLEYAQFLELEVFTRFGATTDERTRAAIEHGRRIRAVLAQPQYAPLMQAEEVALLLALAEGTFDPLPLDVVDRFRARLRPWLAERCKEQLDRLNAPERLSDDDVAALRAAVRTLAGDVAKDAH